MKSPAVSSISPHFFFVCYYWLKRRSYFSTNKSIDDLDYLKNFRCIYPTVYSYYPKYLEYRPYSSYFEPLFSTTWISANLNVKWLLFRWRLPMGYFWEKFQMKNIFSFGLWIECPRRCDLESLPRLVSREHEMTMKVISVCQFLRLFGWKDKFSWKRDNISSNIHVYTECVRSLQLIWLQS